MYLGWTYVGNRLLSATVEYEETGWYDGQIWVKTAEVLARDRLLGSFQVKPVLNRLKNSLVALATSLFICVALLINYEGSQKEHRKLPNEGDRVVAGVYNDESARTFEPDAFHGEPDPLTPLTKLKTCTVVKHGAQGFCIFGGGNINHVSDGSEGPRAHVSQHILFSTCAANSMQGGCLSFWPYPTK